MNIENQNIGNKLNDNIPLCVDLDDSFLKTDTLLESILITLKLKPFFLFLLPFWLIKGRAYLKSKISEIAMPNFNTLPINKEVENYIIQQKELNRKIILTTATNENIAKNIVSQTNLFDDFYASSDRHNLRALNKANFLTKQFGEYNFDYIGNSYDDLKVWKYSKNAIIINPSNKLLNKARKINNNITVINSEKATFYDFIKQIRVHQWLKNILIFFPFLLAHQVNLQNFINSIFAFISFSFLASFVYITNDLFDLEADRQHPTKKNRPIASGRISISKAILSSFILLISGLIISLLLINKYFLAILLAYLIITTMYTFSLKRIAIIDIITLSILYTLRLIAGGISTDVEVSQWLLGFSLFFFLSLATMKRYTELLVIKDLNKVNTSGRGYNIKDIPLIRTIGLASGYLSVLIFSLYLNSQKVISLYNHPKILWLITFSLLYWISRMWLISHRGEMNEDPIVYTAKDKVSYIIGLIIIILLTGASL